MNLEILNAIASTFEKDLNDCNVINLLSELTSHLQNMVNQPQQPNHQQNVSGLKEKIKVKLESTNINNYSPAWKQVLYEIGFKDLLGLELYNQIESIFLNNQITPSTAQSEISKISDKLSTLSQALTNMLQSFQSLGIKMEDLEPGESEIIILIPRISVHENIEGFTNELNELKRIISDFNELAIGSRPDIKLKTIASSEYQIFLEILPPTAVCIIIGIEIIIKLYKDILEIRKSHKELKEKGVPDKNLKGIEEYANGIMSNGISDAVKDLITKFGSNLETGRKKEMEISLKFSLNKLSNRIDSGYNFDVKMKEDKSQTEDSEEGSSKNQEYYKIIQEKSKELEFLNLSGNKILSLPEDPPKKDK